MLRTLAIIGCSLLAVSGCSSSRNPRDLAGNRPMEDVYGDSLGQTGIGASGSNINKMGLMDVAGFPPPRRTAISAPERMYVFVGPIQSSDGLAERQPVWITVITRPFRFGLSTASQTITPLQDATTLPDEPVAGADDHPDGVGMGTTGTLPPYFVQQIRAEANQMVQPWSRQDASSSAGSASGQGK